MARFTWFAFLVLVLLSSVVCVAGPAEDANEVVDHWSAAYTSNDPDAVVKNYWPDAILLGTVSPIISEGTEAIQKYFSQIKGSGNKNVVQERRTIAIDDNAVVVTGFYEFTRMQEGKAVFLRQTRNVVSQYLQVASDILDRGDGEGR
jgi:uncharacterized protein (TIGR02246 family)